jgi:hypothetical protein
MAAIVHVLPKCLRPAYSKTLHQSQLHLPGIVIALLAQTTMSRSLHPIPMTVTGDLHCCVACDLGEMDVSRCDCEVCTVIILMGVRVADKLDICWSTLTE